MPGTPKPSTALRGIRRIKIRDEQHNIHAGSSPAQGAKNLRRKRRAIRRHDTAKYFHIVGLIAKREADKEVKERLKNEVHYKSQVSQRRERKAVLQGDHAADRTGNNRRRSNFRQGKRDHCQVQAEDRPAERN